MADNGKIPFLDLVTPHQELHQELISVFENVLQTAGFVGGPLVEAFERDFAEFCDVKECVGVSSGTDAVRLALIATGVQPGDVVVTVPHTFIATTEAISQAGARLCFVDIDEQTHSMNVTKLREYLERECDWDAKCANLYDRKCRARVAAIIPVHIYGQCADMDPILELTRRYNLIALEDACQAHGAEYFSRNENRWKKAGSMGHAAAFSFYPGKNLGACGEAGAITTNSGDMARKLRMLRDHGQARKYYHDLEGYNNRLDSLQAGLLRVKLGHLAEWNHQRMQVAARYDQLLSSIDGVTPHHRPAWSRPVHHLYVVRVADREALQKHLAEAKIDTGVHYPIPLHLQKAYATFGFKKGDFPVAEKVTSEIVSLPMYPQLQRESQLRIVEKIQEFVSLATVR